MKSGPETIKVDQSLVDTLVKARELANKKARRAYGSSTEECRHPTRWETEDTTAKRRHLWWMATPPPVEGRRIRKRVRSFDGFYHVHPNEGVLGPMSFEWQRHRFFGGV